MYSDSGGLEACPDHGQKTESEKFAGALRVLVDAMSRKRALQAARAQPGQKLRQAFDLTFRPERGMSTRGTRVGGPTESSEGS